jgi:UDP-N-acetylmuramate dehydrogenase
MGWGGLEWAEGLPGTVGGAVFGNAGCYGGDVASTLHSATILDKGQIEEWSSARLGYGYRTSALKQTVKQGLLPAPLVLAACFRLHRADPAQLAEFTARTAAERKAKTPWGNSCGSVFKNPPGESAGRLIEAVGLKGHQVNDAIISDRHANYIVNLGAASANDILALITIARETVQHCSGHSLELEVQIV